MALPNGIILLITLNSRIEFDQCVSQPCHNGASCINGINSYDCICANGYTGLKCEDGN